MFKMILLNFIQQYWWLFSLISICLIGILIIEMIDAKELTFGLNVEQAVKKVNHESYTFVDTREKSAFDTYRIPKAIHISKLVKSNSLCIYYCDDDKNSRVIAKDKGQFFLKGGIESWMKSDMPIKEV